MNRPDHFLFRKVTILRYHRPEAAHAVQRVMQHMGYDNPFDKYLHKIQEILTQDQIETLLAHFNAISTRLEAHSWRRGYIFWMAVHEAFGDLGTKRFAEKMFIGSKKQINQTNGKITTS